MAEPLLTAMVLNLQSHSATSPERAAPFAKARFGCKTHFEHEFILHFEYMIHALFCFLGYFNIEDLIHSLCKNLLSGEFRPESAPVKSSRNRLMSSGSRGIPLRQPLTESSLSVNGVTAYETIDYAIVR